MLALVDYDSDSDTEGQNDDSDTAKPVQLSTHADMSKLDSTMGSKGESVTNIICDNERDKRSSGLVGHSSSSQANFFGLINNDSDDDAVPDDEVVPTARKLDCDAEVPGTGYWKDFQPIVTEASPNQRVNQMTLGRYRTVGKPTPVPFVSAGQLNATPVPERKIYFVHHLVTQNWNRESHSRPRKQEVKLAAHAGVVNRVRWCRKRDYSHLAASASSDSTVKLWNLFTESEPCLGVLYQHEKAVSSLSWSASGRNILSGSYDRTAVITDVEKRQVISTYVHSNHVTKVEYNPSDHRLFMTISRDVITAWDVRQTSKPCRLIRHPGKEVKSFLDFAYINDAKEIMTSTDSCEHNLCVLDVKTGAVVSSEKELFPERYTCPRLVASRQNRTVLAQTQGDYVCEFGVKRPYKLNRSKRFQGHKVAGYPIGFDLTRDSRTLVSGSAESKLHVYDWYSGRTVGTVETDVGVCTDVACHPVLGNVVLIGSWDGQLALIK